MAKSIKNGKISITYKKLGREKAYGLADDFEVVIDSRLKGKKHLEILIHECLHYLYPKASEEEVIEKSIKLTKTLWHEGYRRTDNNEQTPLQDGTL